jgi:hypothetical protein
MVFHQLIVCALYELGHLVNIIVIVLFLDFVSIYIRDTPEALLFGSLSRIIDDSGLFAFLAMDDLQPRLVKRASFINVFFIKIVIVFHELRCMQNGSFACFTVIFFFLFLQLYSS